MKNLTSYRFFTQKLFPRLTFACLLAAGLTAFGQGTQPRQTPTPQDPAADEVLRVSTSIVQTDVSVVDKQGRFVEGLQREDFELKVDGKPQPLLFFEHITAGSPAEASRIAAARGEQPTTDTAAIAETAEYGRSVIFFVDDLHLTSSGILRARQLLLNFIDREMTPGTQVLIASASGQLGFLQQFTSEREVLRAVAGKLSFFPQAALDNERPVMSPYLAIAIDRGDRSALDYMMRLMMSPENAVKLRASRIRRQAAQLSNASMATLESVVRLRSPLPGRQTLFYISEGFEFDQQEADTNTKLQRVADAAARTGTVVYTLDARGLSAGIEALDASSGATADPDLTGYNPIGELSASQQVLRAIAADTGGRALLNTNALEAVVSKTLAETANYYVLAWRPEGAMVATDGAPKFRKISVAIKGRSDLTVRLRRGFINAPTPRATAPDAVRTVAATAGTAKAALNATLNAPIARRELIVDTYPVFADDEQAGSVVVAPVQLVNERLQFATAGDKQQATVDLACIVLDAKGKVVFSEGKTMTVTGDAAGAAGGQQRGKLFTSFSVPVTAPGLYQFRVAAHDNLSGMVGSAYRWVEVPDLKAKRLALSSLFMSETRRVRAAGSDAASETLKADRRFARTSNLLLQFQIYNAARRPDGGAPDATVEVKVLDGNNRAVLTAPPRKATVAADPARIPYAAEIPLAKLAAGAYSLQVTVTDAVGRATATKRVDFIVK